MSVELFLKMDGVTGESRHFLHKDWADVLSWNWSISSNRSSVLPSKNESTSFNEISLIKRIGRDSTDMMKLFAERQVIPNVELSMTPQVGKKEARQKYLRVCMEDVIIKSIVTSGTCDENFFKERVTLLFDRVRFEYNQHDGLAPGTDAVDHIFGWNIAANTGL